MRYKCHYSVITLWRLVTLENTQSQVPSFHDQCYNMLCLTHPYRWKPICIIFCMKHKSLALLKLQSSKREQSPTKTQPHKDSILIKKKKKNLFFWKMIQITTYNFILMPLNTNNPYFFLFLPNKKTAVTNASLGLQNKNQKKGKKKKLEGGGGKRKSFLRINSKSHPVY